jgi:hypothetical protein
MALNTNTNVTAKTILASQHDDRLAEPPVITAVFRRVEPTGQNGVYGLPTYKEHPEPWRYTVRITNPALVVELQKFAVRLLIKDGINRVLAARGLAQATASELNAARDGMFTDGITWDHARAKAWEDWETRRRNGEVFACVFEVTEGKQRMIDAGIPTV